MKKIPFLLTIFLLGAISLLAQDKGGEAQQKNWFFEFRGMKFFVSGVNDRIGNIIRYRETITEFRDPAAGLIQKRIDYSYKKEPLFLSKSSLDFQGEARYRFAPSLWIGLKASYFSADAVKGDIVKTPPPFEVGNSLTREWSGIEFWDANVFALYNDLYPSEVADITYSASDVFRVPQAEALLYFDHFPFYVGAKVAKPYSELRFRITQSAHLSGSRGYGYEYNNDVTLRSVHKSDFGFLAGPVFGLKLSGEWGRFLFDFSLSEALLLGGARYEGVFLDIDDTVIDWSDGVRQMFYYPGDLTYSDSRGMLTPVTALDFKIGIKEGENYSLGIGGFGEFWHGLPLGPTLHRPWDVGNPVNAPSGMEWRIEGKTIMLYGLYLFISANF